MKIQVYGRICTNPEGIDVHKSIDWNEIKPRTFCQPPVTDNGEAVPTPKENDE
ncbi:MAG: hypothetical protein J5554_13095 [Paludibacteraceae bacterium]|nr:hypothetical protein [Paludibacteraceae bacterium]